MEWMKEIGIIGSGNVATQFCVHLQKIGIPPLLIYSRNEESGSELASFYESIYTSELSDLSQCQLIICCISDDALINDWEQLTQFAPIVSTSGQVDVLSLPHKEPTGVFYPLQSISKSKAIDFKHVPFFIEASTPDLLQKLTHLGELFSDTVVQMNAEKRKKLHTAAVFANNFTNHMFQITADLALKNELDFNWFLPLIDETVSKIHQMTPKEAQTGPAKRGDVKTIAAHLEQLSESEQKIYSVISNHILETYKK